MSSKHLIAFSIILLPWIASGQQQTPAEAADQALRARVTEFLQYHVDGNFRKAYDMVADDTKDDYFNSGKARLTGFKIGDIKFSDDFTKATVAATMSKTMAVLGQELSMTTPSTTTWKIENGKWVWYNDVKVSSENPIDLTAVLGPAPAAAKPKNNGQDTGGLPKDLDEKALAAATKSILQQVSVDKNEATLATDKPSQDQVIFHNGMPGSVQLELTAPDIPGFSAKLGQPNVRGGGDAPLEFRYEPASPAERRDPITVRLVVQPLNQAFVIRVNFAASPVPQKPVPQK